MGESRFDVCLRAAMALDRIYSDVSSLSIKNVIVVTHGVTMRALVMRHMNYTPEWFEESLNPDNCAIQLIKNRNDLGTIWTPTKNKPPNTTNVENIPNTNASSQSVQNSRIQGLSGNREALTESSVDKFTNMIASLKDRFKSSGSDDQGENNEEDNDDCEEVLHEKFESLTLKEVEVVDEDEISDSTDEEFLPLSIVIEADTH